MSSSHTRSDSLYFLWTTAIACGVLIATGCYLLLTGVDYRPVRAPSIASASRTTDAVEPSPSQPGEGAASSINLAALAQSLSDGMNLDDLKDVARKFAEYDPRNGLREATRLQDRNLRETFLKTLFAAWGKREGAEVAGFILAAASDGELGGLPRGVAMVTAAMGWGEADPAAAAAWLDENLAKGSSQSSNMYQALVGVMGEWGAADPQAGLAWLHTHPALEQSRVLYSELACGWAHRDLNSALQAALALPLNSDGREGLLNGALVTWGRQSPAEAVDWFRGHVDPEEIPLLVETVKSMTLSLEAKDPPSALTWANSMPQDPLRLELMASITFPWIHDAPEQALKSVQDQLPAGDKVRTQAVANAVRQWSHLDPANAANWLATQEPSAERDQSIVLYADTVSIAEPQKAATWASSIQDPSMRNVALTQAMREWIQKSPEDCRNWCQQQALKLGQPFLDQVEKMIAER